MEELRENLSLAAAKQVLAALREGGDDQANRDGPEIEPQTLSARPRLRGYQIERELGRGAGGVTYLAHKEGSECRVALKILRVALGESPACDRAWRELDVLQQARAPAVPRLLDFGEVAGSLYIATEYLDGTPLDRRYDTAAPNGAEDLRARIRLLGRLARAAHSLHERGVIHRDLKPSNVIVGAGDEPFIIDLGISTLITPDPHLTLTADGSPLGTPSFMAPEQARGERHAISTRSDVYSLGAIGCWLSTGSTPHDLADATLHEAIWRVGAKPPRNPRAIAPQLPKPLAAVLAKACAMKPADRYASAADLAEDLQRWLDREPVLAGRPGVSRAVLRFLALHPILATAAVCVALVVGTIAGTYLAVWRLNQRPANIVRDSSGESRWVQLVAASGRPLHTWRSAQPGGVRFAELYDAGVDLRSRLRVATVIRHPVGLDGRLDNQICIWDALDPSRPLWHTLGTPAYIRAPRDHLPASTSGDFLTLPEAYTVGDAVLIAEVFDQSPGREIIAVHHHRFDPGAIRVYSAQGEVLFEVWHWGAIGRPLWVPEAGLLLATGCNNERPLPELGVRGTVFRWPRVVFAVRPEYKTFGAWLNPGMAAPGEAAHWYKCLLPLESADLASDPRLQAVPMAEGPACAQYLITAAGEPSATLVFLIDPAGNTLHTAPSDGWRQTDHPLRAMQVRLGELPEPP